MDGMTSHSMIGYSTPFRQPSPPLHMTTWQHGMAITTAHGMAITTAHGRANDQQRMAGQRHSMSHMAWHGTLSCHTSWRHHYTVTQHATYTACRATQQAGLHSDHGLGEAGHNLAAAVAAADDAGPQVVEQRRVVRAAALRSAAVHGNAQLQRQGAVHLTHREGGKEGGREGGREGRREGQR